MLDPSNTFRSRAQESDSPSKLPCSRESGKQRYHRRLIWTRGAQRREHCSDLPHAGRSRKRGKFFSPETKSAQAKIYSFGTSSRSLPLIVCDKNRTRNGRSSTTQRVKGLTMERRKMLTTTVGILGTGILATNGHTREIEDDCESCGSGCGDCRSACLTCVTECLEEMKADGKDRQDCIRLCLDCADVCAASASIAARKGPMADIIALACAKACEACAEECVKHDDAACKACAEACLLCAKECRESIGTK